MALRKIRAMVEQSNIGDRLPSEDQLALVCDVSRPTIRTALITLEAEGHIVRRHGLGTYVAEPPPSFHPPIDVLWSVFDVVRHSGFTPSVKNVEVIEARAQPESQKALKLEKGDTVTVISRVIMADHKPGIYLKDYLKKPVIANDFEAFDGESVSQFLSRRYNIQLSYALTNISVMAASEEIALPLRIRKGAPLLVIEQTAFTDDDRPVVYSLGFYREGLVTYAVKRQTSTSNPREDK